MSLAQRHQSASAFTSPCCPPSKGSCTCKCTTHARHPPDCQSPAPCPPVSPQLKCSAALSAFSSWPWGLSASSTAGDNLPLTRALMNPSKRPPTGGPPRPDCALDSDTGLAATTTDQANTVLCRQAVGLPDSAASTHWGQHHDARSSSQCGPPFLALPGRQPRRCLRASVERHASYTTRASRKLAAHPSVVHLT